MRIPASRRALPARRRWRRWQPVRTAAKSPWRSMMSRLPTPCSACSARASCGPSTWNSPARFTRCTRLTGLRRMASWSACRPGLATAPTKAKSLRSPWSMKALPCPAPKSSSCGVSLMAARPSRRLSRTGRSRSRRSSRPCRIWCRAAREALTVSEASSSQGSIASSWASVGAAASRSQAARPSDRLAAMASIRVGRRSLDMDFSGNGETPSLIRRSPAGRGRPRARRPAARSAAVRSRPRACGCTGTPRCR